MEWGGGVLKERWGGAKASLGSDGTGQRRLQEAMGWDKAYVR